MDIPKLEALSEAAIQKRQLKAEKARLETVKKEFQERVKEIDGESGALAAQLKEIRAAITGGQPADPAKVKGLRDRQDQLNLERVGLLEVHIPRADEAVRIVKEQITTIEDAEAHAALVAESADIERRCVAAGLRQIALQNELAAAREEYGALDGRLGMEFNSVDPGVQRRVREAIKNESERRYNAMVQGK